MDSQDRLKLVATLPALSFDYDGLKAWAKGITEKYQGLVVDENDIVGIKSEMAGLNKLKEQLETARKETKKRVSAPIATFERKIKEITSMFEEAYDYLKGQVKTYEDQERENKRRDVQVQIDACLHENGLTGKLVIPVQDSWLNKSKPMKSVKAEIEAQILAHIKAEADRLALEQAKKDRAVAIEEKCAALSQAHGFAIPPSSFLRLHSLEMSLTDAHAQIEKAYEDRALAIARDMARQEELKAHAPAKSAAPAVDMLSFLGAKPAPVMSPAPKPVPRPVRKSMVIYMDFDAAHEQAIRAAISHMRTLCLSLEVDESLNEEAANA